MTDATGATAPLPPLGLGTYGRTGAAGLAALVAVLEIGYRRSPGSWLAVSSSFRRPATVKGLFPTSLRRI
jgi:hypothetical protein